MKFKLCFTKTVSVTFLKKKKSFAHLVEKRIVCTVQVLPILSRDKDFFVTC